MKKALESFKRCYIHNYTEFEEQQKVQDPKFRRKMYWKKVFRFGDRKLFSTLGNRSCDLVHGHQQIL